MMYDISTLAGRQVPTAPGPTLTGGAPQPSLAGNPIPVSAPVAPTPAPAAPAVAPPPPDARAAAYGEQIRSGNVPSMATAAERQATFNAKNMAAAQQPLSAAAEPVSGVKRGFTTDASGRVVPKGERIPGAGGAPPVEPAAPTNAAAGGRGGRVGAAARGAASSGASQLKGAGKAWLAVAPALGAAQAAMTDNNEWQNPFGTDGSDSAVVNAARATGNAGAEILKNTGDFGSFGLAGRVGHAIGQGLTNVFDSNTAAANQSLGAPKQGAMSGVGDALMRSGPFRPIAAPVQGPAEAQPAMAPTTAASVAPSAQGRSAQQEQDAGGEDPIVRLVTPGMTTDQQRPRIANANSTGNAAPQTETGKSIMMNNRRVAQVVREAGGTPQQDMAPAQPPRGAFSDMGDYIQSVAKIANQVQQNRLTTGGIAARSAKQLDTLRKQYGEHDDTTDPDGKKREKIATKIQTLSGQGRYTTKVVPGYIDETGRQVPPSVVVINNHTGLPVEQGASQGQRKALPPGMTREEAFKLQQKANPNASKAEIDKMLSNNYGV